MGPKSELKVTLSFVRNPTNTMLCEEAALVPKIFFDPKARPQNRVMSSEMRTKLMLHKGLLKRLIFVAIYQVEPTLRM